MRVVTNSMINFHKFGFLDAKKLQRYTNNKNYWHSMYNPTWLFIWSNLYKPEIAFDNEFCFIRFLMPEVGMCYYPPLGDGDLAKGMSMIKKDCREGGFDFNIAPIDEELADKIIKLEYKIKDNDKMLNYIYSNEEIAFQKKVKPKRSLAKQFEREHPNAFYQSIKKEDFPQILEFIEAWHQENKERLDLNYYTKLNAIKQMMDHLYEFDMNGIMLRDEEKIYGVAIGTIQDNVSFLHLDLALGSIVGAYEELIICFCKNSLINSRYLCMENELDETSNLGVKPIKKEKIYATFRI